MTSKSLFEQKKSSDSRLWNLPSSPEVDHFLKKTFPELLAHKPQGMLLDIQKTEVSFAPEGKEGEKMGVLIIPLWQKMTDRRINELLELLALPEPKPSFKKHASEKGEFTLREREVVHFLVEGKSYKTISQLLSISVDTVKYHMKNVYLKLEVNNREDAVALAKTKGWI